MQDLTSFQKFKCYLHLAACFGNSLSIEAYTSTLRYTVYVEVEIVTDLKLHLNGCSGPRLLFNHRGDELHFSAHREFCLTGELSNPARSNDNRIKKVARLVHGGT